ncbi:unnamed protein product, partial [Meganyctiphanes norvegica]
MAVIACRRSPQLPQKCTELPNSLSVVLCKPISVKWFAQEFYQQPAGCLSTATAVVGGCCPSDGRWPNIRRRLPGWSVLSGYHKIGTSSIWMSIRISKIMENSYCSHKNASHCKRVGAIAAEAVAAEGGGCNVKTVVQIIDAINPHTDTQTNIHKHAHKYTHIYIYTPTLIHTYKHTQFFAHTRHIYTGQSWSGHWEVHLSYRISVVDEKFPAKVAFISSVVRQQSQLIKVEHQSSAPILRLQPCSAADAFGNARTRRNDNSSRFGKYLDIEFDYRGEPIGGTITNYLLEKSRVTNQGLGERNFHIFYQILSGADIQTLKLLKLQRNLENYRLLRSTRHSPAETLDDRTEYHITKRALDALDISSFEQMEIFKLVAAVLKLGNLSFSPVNNIDGTEGCALDNQYEIHEICDLVRCEVDTLSLALQSRTVETHGDTIVAELSASEATRARDALCRALYSRLFTWVVQRINDSIKVKTLGRRKVLGILDMFGFEMMDVNSFEQLVINFCNEKLHQVLMEVMLKEIQEDYLREGIEFVPIEVPSSKETVDLIENRQTGLISVLEDVSGHADMASSRSGTDVLLQKLAHICSQHPTFEIKGGRHSHSDNNIPAESFRIRHFAGKVTYSTAGFIEKNVDFLHRGLSRAMYQCDHHILKEIFPEGNPRRTTLKRPALVSSQVLISISALVRNLRTKQPHLITCIKPNELKQPRILESALVLHQIKYLGLVEQAMVQCDGWSFRCSHEVFLTRFGMLSLHTWPMWRGASLEGCALLLADLPLTPQQYTFGRTKVYIKSQRAVKELEEYRRERLEDLAILVQKTWRGWHQKLKYKKKRQAQITISSTWRRWKLNKHDPETSKSNLAFIKGWRCFFVLARERAREKQYKKMVENSASIIYEAYLKYQRWKLLSRLIAEPPSESPIDTCSWLAAPLIVQDVSICLRRLHHKWRCYRYRLHFDQTARNRMREKVTASIIFKDRKASYPKRISNPDMLNTVETVKQCKPCSAVCGKLNRRFTTFSMVCNKNCEIGENPVTGMLLRVAHSLLNGEKEKL